MGPSHKHGQVGLDWSGRFAIVEMLVSRTGRALMPNAVILEKTTELKKEEKK